MEGRTANVPTVIIAVESDPDSPIPPSSPSPTAKSDQLPTRVSPNVKRQRCYNCGQHPAMRLCICQFPLKSYCSHCWPAHLKTKGPKMHLLVPMHAADMLTSEESVPDFITREVFSNNVAEALNNNLIRVAEAKENLKKVCERLHREIETYMEVKIKELTEIEVELEGKIEEALKGIEEIRYVPYFVPRNEPERLILEEWRNSVENMVERLSMFVSTANAEHLILQLPSITYFHANYVVLYPPTSHQPRTFLPCVQSNVLRSLSLTTHTWREISLSLHTDITHNSAVSFLTNGDLFACGGKTHNKAYIVDGLSLEIQEIAPMLLPRHSHGIVATADFIYIFGGRGENADYKECEAYNLRVKSWFDMRSMHKPRSSITPCRLYMKIYIAGGFSNTFETFSLTTDKFELRSLPAPVLSGATCIAAEGTVLIFGRQILLEIDAECKTVSRVAPLQGNDWWSTIAPVYFNGEVYFCRRSSAPQPQVYKVNVITKKVEEVA